MRSDPRHFERQLQIYCVRRFRRHVMPWDAKLMMVANGEYRPPETTDLLHALGLERGAPDLQMILHDRRLRWIEVKLDRTDRHARTDLFDEQREFHTELEYFDHQVDVVRSWTELWAIATEEHVPYHGDPFHQVEQTSFTIGRQGRTRGLSVQETSAGAGISSSRSCQLR